MEKNIENINLDSEMDNLAKLNNVTDTDDTSNFQLMQRKYLNSLAIKLMKWDGDIMKAEVFMDGDDFMLKINTYDKCYYKFLGFNALATYLIGMIEYLTTIRRK